MSSLGSRQSRPAEQNNPTQYNTSHTGAIVGPIVAVVVILILAYAAFYAYRYLRARRLGLPPPSLNPFASQPSISTRNYPARGGFVGWVQSRFRGYRNKRTAGGAYEGGRGQNFGRLDPDEAWDTRVGHEADDYAYGGAGYEEQELGLSSSHAREHSGNVEPYAGGGYDAHGARGYGPAGGLDEITGERGRTRNGKSELDERYDEETGRSSNPFGDQAERSDMGLRGVSPRPANVDTAYSGASGALHVKKDSKEDSPTERRSVFREAV